MFFQKGGTLTDDVCAILSSCRDRVRARARARAQVVTDVDPTVVINGQAQIYPNTFPFYGARQVDAEGTLSNGHYAEWYWSPEYMNFQDSPVENFNWACATSTMAMTCSLLLAAVVLATGAANIFTRDTANTHGFQYRKIIRAYLFWVRFVLVGIVFMFLFGLWTFIQTFAYLVYIKFNDRLIEEGRFKADGVSFVGQWFYGSESVYNYTSTATLWCLYFWIFIGTLIVSKGQHSAYCYPVRPPSDVGVQAKNQKTRNELMGFTSKMDKDGVPGSCLNCYEDAYERGEINKNSKAVQIDGKTLLQYLQECLPTANAANCGPNGNAHAVYATRKKITCSFAWWVFFLISLGFRWVHHTH